MASKKSEKSGYGHLKPLGEGTSSSYQKPRERFNALPKSFHVEDFAKPLKAVEVDKGDPGRLNLVVCFGGASDTTVAKDLTIDQVEEVIQAKSLSVLKPKGCGE